MNGLILCTALTLNIFSMPAGNTVVGQVPAYRPVYLMDGSLMRDWVFIGKPSQDGISPRGWVKYEYLTICPPPPSRERTFKQEPGADGCPLASGCAEPRWHQNDSLPNHENTDRGVH